MDYRPEYDFKVIGANLRKLRVKKQLSVEQVREYMLLGTTQAIYKWERGEGMPQADTLLALLQLYGVDRIDTILKKDTGLQNGECEKGLPEAVPCDFFVS